MFPRTLWYASIRRKSLSRKIACILAVRRGMADSGQMLACNGAQVSLVMHSLSFWNWVSEIDLDSILVLSEAGLVSEGPATAGTPCITSQVGGARTPNTFDFAALRFHWTLPGTRSYTASRKPRVEVAGKRTRTQSNFNGVAYNKGTSAKARSARESW